MIIKLIIAALLCLLPLTSVYSQVDDSKDIMETIKYIIQADLNKRLNNEVEITSLRIIKGHDALYNNEGKILKKVTMDRYMGKNRAYYAAIIEDKKEGFSHVIIDAAFDGSAEVFVTSRSLQRGSTLTSSDFYPVRYKSSRMPAGAIVAREQIEGKILSTALGQGVVIRDNHVSDTLIIKRGQRVNIIIETETMSISGQGVLKGDAALGGITKVYFETTKKELQGTLVSQNMVKVKIK